MTLLDYFTDPVLSAPTIGSMLMCFTAACVGVLVHLKRQSLAGEVLAHACYPGVLCALLIDQLILYERQDTGQLFIVLSGACLSAFLGMYAVEKLQSRFSLSADAALSLVLASFFGIGLAILSAVQMPFPMLYRQMQAYLFGQAATMTDLHITVYGVLSVLVLALVLLFYRPIQLVIFDPQFAEISGMNRKGVERLLRIMLVLAIVIGIRSVGVVLISAMLIFPAASARAWASSLRTLLLVAGGMGLFCGFFGVFSSHEMSLHMRSAHTAALSFPTGPMIVMVACAIFVISWCCAPKKGLIFCELAQARFRLRCCQENLLKVLWKLCSTRQDALISWHDICASYQGSHLTLRLLLFSFCWRGWLEARGDQSYMLTGSGMLHARKIIRLHRLWEVYLVEHCGVAADRVHPLAEEMEHIITPELEKELDTFLQHPSQDPHAQPIPRNEERFLLSDSPVEQGG